MSYVEVRTNHLAKTAGNSTHPDMSRTFRMIQLNVRKQGAVHDSLMNDERIRNAAVVAIQEPQARGIQGRLLTTPMGHHKWTKMVPSTTTDSRRSPQSNGSSPTPANVTRHVRPTYTTPSS